MYYNKLLDSTVHLTEISPLKQFQLVDNLKVEKKIITKKITD